MFFSHSCIAYKIISDILVIICSVYYVKTVQILMS